MKKVEVELAIKKLQRAFERLNESVKVAKDELDKDGVIQRFEFTVELLWKTLKIALEYNKILCSSPRDCVKKAFKYGLIDDDEIVMDMLDDRNKSSEDEKMSGEIFERIREVYIDTINTLIGKLAGKI